MAEGEVSFWFARATGRVLVTEEIVTVNQETPALPASSTRTLTFEVVPWSDRRVSRILELRADQTLHDLHVAIQSVFELDDDHAYAFYLNNRAWDPTFEYGNSERPSTRHANAARLDSLPLRVNKRILYVFDLGDDLRHEVRFVAEGVADARISCPRLVSSVGEAPAQYPELAEDLGEQPAPPEARPLAPSLTELVTAVTAALNRYDDRRYARRGAAPVTQAELLAEAELASALLDRSAGDLRTIVDLEHAVQASVWRWLCELPLELARAGSTEAGLRLGEHVHAIVPHSPVRHTLPLLFALALREPEAREHVERNLAEYPDDSRMLLRAGQAFEVLGELGRAEEALRESIHWAGNELHGRQEAVSSLVKLLRDLGRAEDAAELLRAEETEAFERRLHERSWRSQAPIRRASAKVGRNDLCSCGSKKKFKRCCGTQRHA